jgi:hypothetical protein
MKHMQTGTDGVGNPSIATSRLPAETQVAYLPPSQPEISDTPSKSSRSDICGHIQTRMRREGSDGDRLSRNGQGDEQSC